MGKEKKAGRVPARLPRGLADRGAGELAAQRAMLQTIRTLFMRYGFDSLETPTIEYTEALGKFLPDEDRPNEGVFSFQDDDEQWLSLRYDLTAPLARYVARITTGWRSLFAATAKAMCSATKSRGRGASASSCNSTPTRSEARRSPPTRRCA